MRKTLYRAPASARLTVSPVLSTERAGRADVPAVVSGSVTVAADFPLQARDAAVQRREAIEVLRRVAEYDVVADAVSAPVLRDNGAAQAQRLFVVSEGQPSGWPPRAFPHGRPRQSPGRAGTEWRSRAAA